MALPISMPGLDNVPVDAKPYWLGATPMSPRHYFTLAGLWFPMVSEQVSDPPSGSVHMIRNRMPGTVNYLLPGQVKAIHKRAKELVIRMMGRGPKARRVVLNTTSATMDPHTKKMMSTYRPDKSDHPVACYIWLLPVDEKLQYVNGAQLVRVPPTIEPVPAEIIDRLAYKPKTALTAEEAHAGLIEQLRNHPSHSQ